MSVVVPFLGDRVGAEALIDSVSGLELRAGDEVLIADNTPAGSAWPPVPAGIEVVSARGVRSSYHARNVAAARARGEWILFMDADCRPPPALLDDYLSAPPRAGVALLAGEVEGVAGDDRIGSRWLVARRHLAVEPQLARGTRPMVGTASLMVSRTAWTELAGFAEVRSGADYELCVRAAEAGLGLEYRPRATVLHVHSGGLRPALSRARRYGAGSAWLNRLHPGSAAPPAPVRAVGRAVAGWAWWTLTGRFERGAFKAIDGAWAVAFAWGWHRGSNAASGPT